MGISGGIQGLATGYNTATFTKPDVTVAGSSGAWTTANSPITLFTVSGLVSVIAVGVTTTALTSTGGTGTLALGTTVTPGVFIAATTVNNGTQFTLNSVWQDTTPTATSPGRLMVNSEAEVLVNATSATNNILLTIATNNMTAGGMTIYAYWRPRSPGATVTAATP